MRLLSDRVTISVLPGAVIFRNLLLIWKIEEEASSTDRDAHDICRCRAAGILDAERGNVLSAVRLFDVLDGPPSRVAYYLTARLALVTP